MSNSKKITGTVCDLPRPLNDKTHQVDTDRLYV